jgi:putative ABC transport system permease protein
MGLFESLHVAVSSLWANKLRSSLTILGLVNGVGAVIALMSIGQGAEAVVAAELSPIEALRYE